MKLLIGCLIASLFSAVLAEVDNNEENKTETTGKGSISKPKRDAGFLSGVYHGPSYKYLPPSTSASSYDTFPGRVGSYAGYSGGHISGIGGVYRTATSGHGHHRHHGYPSTGYRNTAFYHSLDSDPTLNYGSGHHGYVFPSPVNYNAGQQGSTYFSRGGYKGVASTHTGAKFAPSDFPGSRPHTFAFPNGHSVGPSSASGSGYHYTKGFGGSYTPVPTGFQSAVPFAASLGGETQEEHHADHVHNGAEEHVYVVSDTPAGLGIDYEAKPTPVHQHPFPIAAAAPFNTKYYSQTTDQRPNYAAGHKGLGHFGFTANKPQAVHASLSGAGFQQQSYSKAPFQPSTFLGAKFEGSANGDVHTQQYLPPSEEATASTGYDYALPTETYQNSNHHQTMDIQTTSLHEPDPVYRPTKHNTDSVFELSSDASGNYLTPTDSYGIPYSH